MVRSRRVIAAVVALAAVTLLTACTNEPEQTPPPSAFSTQAPSPTPTAEPDPELIPDGTATDNLPYFDFINEAFLAGGNPGGRPIIDNLVAAGFEKAAMQLTADKTAIGGTVDSLQFSVQIGNDCLIGQAGAGGYTRTAGAALGTGGCLVGTTRTIDW